MLTVSQAADVFVELLHKAHPELALGVQIGMKSYRVDFLGKDDNGDFKFKAKLTDRDLYYCSCACYQNPIYLDLFTFQQRAYGDTWRYDPHSFISIDTDMALGTYTVGIFQSGHYYINGCPYTAFS